ncbi:MAG: hypothetical protein QXM83_04130 [Ignisphaera sp.]
MTETETKKELKESGLGAHGISVNKLHKDLFRLMEISSTLNTVIHDKSIELKGYKKLLKHVTDLIGDKHLVIVNEVRNGNTEKVQYTLDAFATIQDTLEDLAYEIFETDSDENEKMMSAIENLKLTYDPVSQSILIKGMTQNMESPSVDSQKH